MPVRQHLTPPRKHTTANGTSIHYSCFQLGAAFKVCRSQVDPGCRDEPSLLLIAGIVTVHVAVSGRFDPGYQFGSQLACQLLLFRDRIEIGALPVGLLLQQFRVFR